MEYRKSTEQVKRIVDIIKPYLIYKGLNLDAENDASRYSKINKKYKEYGEDFFVNDKYVERVDYYLTEKSGLNYLVIYVRENIRKIFPNVYPIHPKNLYVDSDYNSNYYRILFDHNGKVFIDLDELYTNYISSEITGTGYSEIKNPIIFLDDTNLLIPTKSKVDDNQINITVKSDENESNYYTHYKIKDNGIELVRKLPIVEKYDTLNENIRISDTLNKNGLIEYNDRIYNYRKGEFSTCPKFDNIYSERSDNIGKKLYYYLSDLNLDTVKLINLIEDKVKKNNLMIGFKEIHSSSGDIEEEYKIFTFLDSEANIMDEIYYVDGEELKKLPASNLTFNDIIEDLRIDLRNKVEKRLTEKSNYIQEKNLEKVKKMII